jgi:hypothetical protein
MDSQLDAGENLAPAEGDVDAARLRQDRGLMRVSRHRGRPPGAPIKLAFRLQRLRKNLNCTRCQDNQIHRCLKT